MVTQVVPLNLLKQENVCLIPREVEHPRTDQWPFTGTRRCHLFASKYQIHAMHGANKKLLYLLAYMSVHLCVCITPAHKTKKDRDQEFHTHTTNEKFYKYLRFLNTAYGSTSQTLMLYIFFICFNY